MNKYDYYVFVGTYTKLTWFKSHEKNKFGSLRVFRESTLKSDLENSAAQLYSHIF
tara:strand:+ start:61 stop:225 length:165 start_codon:yes stop_codon:yes gene_type:complete